MSVIVTGKRTLQGRILIRQLDSDDWWLTSVSESRYQDRGSITDPVVSSEDWGILPKA